MKAYALVVLSLLLILSYACNGNKKTPSNPLNTNCENFPKWDSIISNEVADAMQDGWNGKWDYPDSSRYHRIAQQIPDSFFVYFSALEDFAEGLNHCGFRMYWGLTEAGDPTSMCLIITGINDHFGDILDDNRPAIFFTNATTADQIAPDVLDQHNKTISLEEAQQYTSNWRCYNGISRDNDALGNVECNVERQVPAGGILPAEIQQKIPLAVAFGPSLSVFEKLMSGDSYKGSFEAYVFYNSFTITGPNAINQDLFIRGYGQAVENGPHAVGLTAVDVTGGCPIVCNIEDALQAD